MYALGDHTVNLALSAASLLYFKFLMDHGDAGALAIRRSTEGHQTTVDFDCAAVPGSGVNAAKHFDESRLAGTVFADEPKDFTDTDVKIHVVKRPHAGKLDGEP